MQINVKFQHRHDLLKDGSLSNMYTDETWMSNNESNNELLWIINIHSHRRQNSSLFLFYTDKTWMFTLREALTLSSLQTALGQSKTMNGRVHWSYSVLKGLTINNHHWQDISMQHESCTSLSWSRGCNSWRTSRVFCSLIISLLLWNKRTDD